MSEAEQAEMTEQTAILPEKRKPGRPPKNAGLRAGHIVVERDDDDEEDKEVSLEDELMNFRLAGTDKITYIPIHDQGDPVKIIWNEIEFRANVPVKVPRSKTVECLLPIRTRDANGNIINGIMQTDGQIHTRHIAKKVPMVLLAKRNHSFSVNGAEPVKQNRIAQQRAPMDPDQYRSYALRWMQEATTVEQLDMRWSSEGELRKRCGCTEKDVQWLRSFLDAQRIQLPAGKPRAA